MLDKNPARQIGSWWGKKPGALGGGIAVASAVSGSTALDKNPAREIGSWWALASKNRDALGGGIALAKARNENHRTWKCLK